MTYLTAKPTRKILFLFSASESLLRMLAKGNIDYLRHYECSFDRIFVIYLQGGDNRLMRMGTVIMIGLGGQGRIVDILLSPFRLFALVHRIRTPYRLTADVLYAWWATSLSKFLLGFQFTLMPVCMPRELWKLQARPFIFIEHGFRRAFSRLSFLAADRVLTVKAFGNYVSWLSAYPPASKILIVANTVPDALPTPNFFRSLNSARLKKPVGRDSDRKMTDFKLVYVGRLEPEKQVSDLISMMIDLCRKGDIARNITMQIIGDGSLKIEMQHRAMIAGLSARVNFRGVVANSDLPAILAGSQVFLSTLTGTSLREAALCKLPIVAYDCDWVSGLLVDEETALLVPRGDTEAMADAVQRLAVDRSLREKLASNIKTLADSLWSPASLKESLALAFPD
jgi:glycosyltransferase involved in cell wall biosynthesis